MDEYVVMNKSDLTTMADTIRETLGSTDSIAVGDLANKLIESIEAGGGGSGDIAPFSSVVCGTFTSSYTKTLAIDGISNCKIFAMRCVEGKYYEETEHIVSAVLVNTEASSATSVGAVKGVSAYYSSKGVCVSPAGMYPEISGDTLTFNYYLVGTYEYVMVSK